VVLRYEKLLQVKVKPHDLRRIFGKRERKFSGANRSRKEAAGNGSVGREFQ
jgi:hypothetical protein